MEIVKYTTEKSRPNLFRKISGGLKATITLLLVLFVSISTFGQKIDLVNAPINPIALEYKKEHFNLKGDVYGYGYRVFSKEGMLIYEYGISRGLHYLYKNGFPYADTEGKLYEFNSQGYLSKKTYASLGKQTQTYTYNTKGLITKVSNTKGYNATYEYDDKGRLSKSNVGGNIREFSYQKNGEQLIVTIKDLSKNPAVVTKHIYKNGIKIGENDNLYNLKYDKLGNISGYENAIYYSDIENRNNEISVVYTKSSYSIDPLSDCKFYINGQKADFLYKQIASIQSKDIFIYNPFTEKYYIIENAINDAKSGQKQVFSKVFINSPYYLLNRKGSSLSLGYKGAVLANTANGMRDGALKVYNAPVYLAYDKTLNQTFYGDLDNTNTTGYYPLQQISPNDNVVYLKAGENQYSIVIEGKVNAKENPTHKLISSNNGCSIITDDKNNPLYYLPGTASATLNKLYAGRKYNSATDKIQSANNTTQTTTTAGANTDNTNADKTTKTKAQTPYRPFEYIDISNKTLSPEVKTFIEAYNSNPEKLGDHITNMGKTLQNKNYTGGKQYERFLALMTEVYNVDKYLAFRTFMRVDKKTLDEAMKLMPKEMREYIRQEAKYVIQKQKEMEAEQNTTTKSSNTNTSNPYSGMSTEAGAYMASYEMNPKRLKTYIGNMHKSWEQKGYSEEKISQTYADLFKEIYAKDKYPAFLMVIHLPDSWLGKEWLSGIFNKLTKEQQLYIQETANNYKGN